MGTLLLLLFVSIVAPPAWACECLVGDFSPEASKRNIAEARVIFEGEVKSVVSVAAAPPDTAGRLPPPSRNSNFSRLTVSVHRVHKGSPESKVVTLYADTVTSCGIRPEDLDDLTFFIAREVEGDLAISPHCGNYLTEEDRKALLAGRYTDERAPAPR